MSKRILNIIFKVLFIIIFNYMTITLLIQLIFKIDLSLTQFYLELKHEYSIIRVLFESIYYATFHILIMVLIYLFVNFITNNKPKRALLFYLKYVIIYIIFFIITALLSFFIQLPLIDNYIPFFGINSETLFLYFTKHPILYLLIPIYHTIFLSFFTIGLYKYLLKKEEKNW